MITTSYPESRSGVVVVVVVVAKEKPYLESKDCILCFH